MELYQPYKVNLFNEDILKSFLRSLLQKEMLSDKTIHQYYNDVLDFDLYLTFICRDWDCICDDDFELFKKILKRMGLNNRGIRLRITHIKRFKEYYGTNKFKEKFI